MCFVCWMDDLKNLQTSGYFKKKLCQVKVHCKCNQHHLSIINVSRSSYIFFSNCRFKTRSPQKSWRRSSRRKKEKVNQLTGSKQTADRKFKHQKGPALSRGRKGRERGKYIGRVRLEKVNSSPHRTGIDIDLHCLKLQHYKIFSILDFQQGAQKGFAQKKNRKHIL